MTELSGDPSGLMAPVEKVDEAVVALSRQRRVELILVIVATVAAVMASLFSGWGVFQVRSCTDPKGKCYRENTLRARNTTRQFLEELDRQHKVIQCLLLVLPSERAEEDQKECDAKHPKKEGP